MEMKADDPGQYDEVVSEPERLVIIADAHEMVRESIKHRIEKGCDVSVVADTADGYSTLKAIRQHQPALLIMDLGLERPSGTDVLKKAVKIHPDMRVIVVTSEPTVANAFFAMSQGAMTFMPKQASAVDFVNAVRATLSGFSYMPNNLMMQFVKSRHNLSRVGNVFGLSPRELEIMKACSTGRSTKEVANDLNISVRTVETHRHNIYRKTNCKNHQGMQSIAECL